ncbi:response regulator transcription factor [Candidatus Gracilibacteria bacterium 28_42_T64]|nr:response regulator transcription factor [Candidatus Gracilibacteria bacterium 28_42_T64]
MKVLVIEDNELLSRNLVRYLELKNIESDTSFDGKDGLYKASIHFYDAIILDINLPEIDGLEVCKNLREKGKNTPIIMLTSRSSKTDIIVGLNNGADDYLVKPFDYQELIARIDSLTRRNLKNKSISKIEVGEYIIDLEKIEVSKGEEKIKLSTLEFDLFKCLVQNRGKVLSRKDIYEKVWGEFEEFMFSKTVDVYIGYLRKKLGREMIETRKGFGYIIN